MDKSILILNLGNRLENKEQFPFVLTIRGIKFNIEIAKELQRQSI
jgi:hypothetical protein